MRGRRFYQKKRVFKPKLEKPIVDIAKMRMERQVSHNKKDGSDKQLMESRRHLKANRQDFGVKRMTMAPSAPLNFRTLDKPVINIEHRKS